MREKELGRRRFLRSTATAGLGVIGGIAATGTAAANSEEIRLSCNSNEWQYQIITTEAHADLEKGGKADAGDTISSDGDFADGYINDGGVDNYWMASDDAVKEIKVTYNDYGYINVSKEDTSSKATINVERDENPDYPGYDYTIDGSEAMEPHDTYFEYGQDEIWDGGSPWVGTVTPNDGDTGIDAVWTYGPPARVFIEDPDAPGLGLTINLPNSA